MLRRVGWRSRHGRVSLTVGLAAQISHDLGLVRPPIRAPRTDLVKVDWRANYRILVKRFSTDTDS
ncbi:hypothetical protein EYF80_011597 [Liparis tanakae]|uniref:Uncharacterized protein n=1 Tax=Liparis tanakae TaxID=230148 RepID=A0A4Z2ILL7_9TELE|nr:hypothetical protein EYF80_011597 [Liparis tanakae]